MWKFYFDYFESRKLLNTDEIKLDAKGGQEEQEKKEEEEMEERIPHHRRHCMC